MKSFTYQGDTIRYRDTGRGAIVVFVHGTPSSSREFENVITGLQESYRCVAIDHLGFGESDKPSEGDYSLVKHTERLQALFEHLNIDRFHLVVHDFGGAIGLPIALARPNDVLSLTLMNTWAWPLEETEPKLERQKRVLSSKLIEWLYLHMNFSARVLVKSGWGEHAPLTKEKHRAYKAAFTSAAERMGTVGFLRALIHSAEPAWEIHKELPKLASKPALVLWGMADNLITSSTLDRWTTLMPDAKVKTFENVGHFVADEAPELVIPALRSFLEASS